jgi:hypothetical protein
MGHLDVPTEGIGNKVNLVPEFTENLDTVIFAKRSTPGLEKWLRG